MTVTISRDNWATMGGMSRVQHLIMHCLELGDDVILEPLADLPSEQREVSD